MEDKIKLCVFDDNDKVRDALALVLMSAADRIEIYGSYADGNNVEENLAQSSPDVILMDIDMPGINGVEAVKRAKKIMPQVQIIMFTVFENEDLIFQSICAGASGYLLKNAQPQKIIDSILEVTEGGAPMTPGIARKVLERMQGITKNNYNISARENDVLSYLVQGLSHKMIADKCHISYETVRSHIKKIYEKLHVGSMTEAVAKAINERLV